MINYINLYQWYYNFPTKPDQWTIKEKYIAIELTQFMDAYLNKTSHENFKKQIWYYDYLSTELKEDNDIKKIYGITLP